ncbi:MAG: hypothetical protein J0H64_04985, partial [Actinobacteria bacterium]|nr:hypothetical protein [Actinomycetota bacterium]
MTQPDELAEMQARIEALEDQNRTLRDEVRGSTKGRGRARAALAAVLVLLSILIAPIAVLGSGTRYELVYADRFGQTFAPLAEKPEVQRFVTDQVVVAIDENMDIDGLVNELFSGLESLNLPPKAGAAIGMLQGPAAQGVRSMIQTAVQRIVESPQFARLWEGLLRQTHEQAVAVIQGDPNAALQLAGDGTLS